MARTHKLRGVAFTYNDPAVWIEYVHDVFVAFRAAGLYTALVTAGYLSLDALDYVAPYTDAFKFDLKAPDGRGWAWLGKVNDPGPCLEATVRAQDRHGCHVEVVSNIVPGMNDDDDSLTAMATWVRDALGPRVPWHVTRFLPEYELYYVPATPITTLERALGHRPSGGVDVRVCGQRARPPGHADGVPGLRSYRDPPRLSGAHEVWVRDGCCLSCGRGPRRGAAGLTTLRDGAPLCGAMV